MNKHFFSKYKLNKLKKEKEIVERKYIFEKEPTILDMDSLQDRQFIEYDGKSYVKAYLKNNQSMFKCPWCKETHEHGVEQGFSHRVSHCDSKEYASYFICVTRTAQNKIVGFVKENPVKKDIELIDSTFENALYDCFQKATDKDRISKTLLIKVLQEKLGETYSWESILKQLKMMGFKYERQLKINKERGVILGLCVKSEK